jgi:hypothetical protein
MDRAAHREVSRVEVDAEATRVEAIQESAEHCTRFQAGFEGQDGTDAGAMAAQYWSMEKEHDQAAGVRPKRTTASAPLTLPPWGNSARPYWPASCENGGGP